MFLTRLVRSRVCEAGKVFFKKFQPFSGTVFGTVFDAFWDPFGLHFQPFFGNFRSFSGTFQHFDFVSFF